MAAPGNRKVSHPGKQGFVLNAQGPDKVRRLMARFRQSTERGLNLYEELPARGTVGLGSGVHAAP
jgi:hypothetical protein